MLMRIDRLDLLRAYATFSRHRFPGYVVCRSLPSLDEQLAIVSLDDGDEQTIAGSHSEETSEFSHDCIALLDGLEDVVSMIRDTKSRGPQVEAFWFKPLLEGLVRRLLRRAPGVALDKRSILIKGCCRLVVLISVDILVREAFGTPNYSSHFVRKVKSDLLDMDTKLGRTLYWLIVATLHGQKVDLGEPARGLYVAEAVLLAMDVSENTWRLVRARLLEYLETQKPNRLVDTHVSQLWDLEPITQIVIENWI